MFDLTTGRLPTLTVSLMYGMCGELSLYVDRLPEKYWNLKLPHKLPPKKNPLDIYSLPMLGFLEQTVANAVIKSLTSVGNIKPKYPFLSSTRSALVYVAFHLKGLYYSITDVTPALLERRPQI